MVVVCAVRYQAVADYRGRGARPARKIERAWWTKVATLSVADPDLLPPDLLLVRGIEVLRLMLTSSDPICYSTASKQHHTQGGDVDDILL